MIKDPVLLFQYLAVIGLIVFVIVFLWWLNFKLDTVVKEIYDEEETENLRKVKK